MLTGGSERWTVFVPPCSPAMHLPADSMPWSIIHPSNTPTATRQAMTRTRMAPDSQGDVSDHVGPLGSRKPAGFRLALAALLLAAMVAPLGAWAADGQPAEGTTTPPSASATTDSNTGNSDAIRPGSGGGNTGVGGTDSQVSTDIQNSQGQGMAWGRVSHDGLVSCAFAVCRQDCHRHHAASLSSIRHAG